MEHSGLPHWPEERVARTSEVIGALDSPLRLQILLMLNAKPHVVHELVRALAKSQPLVSQHLRVLKNAGLVSATRSGREVVYELASPGIMTVIDTIATLADGDPDDELAERRATRGPGLIDARGGMEAVAVCGPPPTSTPEQDPGLVPDKPVRPQ